MGKYDELHTCHNECERMEGPMTPEEVWEEACRTFTKASASGNYDASNKASAAVIRTAMEAYAAEKVAEALAAEPTEAMVEAGKECALEHTDDEIDVADIFRAMQAANQHHGGNDADT